MKSVVSHLLSLWMWICLVPIISSGSFGDEYEDYIARSDALHHSIQPESTDSYDYYVDEPHVNILSVGQEFTVPVGATVDLPCVADDPEKVMLWRKDSFTIFLGRRRLTDNLRFSLSHRDFTLTVSNVSANDAGKFECSILGFEPDTVTHTLAVIWTPVITAIPAEEYVDEGTSVSFSCYAGGPPTDEVYWIIENDLSGLSMIVSNSISYEHVEVGHTGNYTCVVKRGEKLFEETKHLHVVSLTYDDTSSSFPNSSHIIIAVCALIVFILILSLFILKQVLTSRKTLSSSSFKLNVTNSGGA